jgi:hypothetical protein
VNGDGDAISIGDLLSPIGPSLSPGFTPGEVEHMTVSAPGPGGFSMPDMFGPGGVGFDAGQFSGIGSYADSFGLPSGNVMSATGFTPPKKKEEKKKRRQPFRDWVKARRRGETPFRDRWQDPEERKKILKRGGLGLLSLLSPQFRMAQNIYKFGKGMKENPQGIMGALGNMFMRQKLGPNADLFGAGMGLARGAPAGDIFKNLLVGRGLRAGIGQLAPSLFKKAYAEQGMRGVHMMNQLLSTIMPMAHRGITGKLGGGDG